MIRFLLSKWLIPKRNPRLQNITVIFFALIFLCSFLSLLASFVIHFIENSVLLSFMQKDFHLTFLNTVQSRDIWEQNKSTWEHNTKSSITEEIPYIRKDGLLTYRNRKLPIQLQLVQEKFISIFHIQFKEGKWDDSIPSIVITEEMAYQLGVQSGDILDFYFVQTQGNISQIHLLITGILQDNIGTDPVLAFGPLEGLQDFFYNQVHTGILLKNTKDIPLWKKTMLTSQHFYVQDLLSRHWNMLYSLEWEKILLYFTLCVILIISGVILYAGFQIFFMELKMRWFMLKILGMSTISILKVYLIQTILLIMTGFITGGLTAFILISCYTLYTHSEYQILSIIDMPSIMGLFTIELCIGFCAFIIPVYKAYQQSIMEGLKNAN